MYFLMCLIHSYEVDCGDWQIRLRPSSIYANEPCVIIIITNMYIHIYTDTYTVSKCQP